MSGRRAQEDRSSWVILSWHGRESHFSDDLQEQTTIVTEDKTARTVMTVGALASKSGKTGRKKISIDGYEVFSTKRRQEIRLAYSPIECVFVTEMVGTVMDIDEEDFRCTVKRWDGVVIENVACLDSATGTAVSSAFRTAVSSSSANDTCVQIRSVPAIGRQFLVGVL